MSDTSPADLKRALRADLRDRRENLEYDPELADGILRNLAGLVNARGSKVIACYLPFGNEPDTELFIDWALEAGIQVLLPVSLDSGELDWVVYEGETEVGIFGFAEAVGKKVDLASADLIIAPALAVDQSGNRLGKGKGYYDRALSDQTAPVIAVVYDDELLETIPIEPHDQPVAAVVTPSQLVVFTGLN